jgi:hypothetical protein
VEVDESRNRTKALIRGQNPALGVSGIPTIRANAA